MTMTPRVRKFALTAHVISSVGWLGAVAGFLALAAAGLISQDARMVRTAYLAMDLTYWFVIVPAGLASLLTGLVLSLGTTWGLFRHYWVLMKFLLTIPAIVLLLVHTQPVNYLAGVARRDSFIQHRSPRAANPIRGRRRRHPAGVALGHDAVGIQTAWHDPVRNA